MKVTKATPGHHKYPFAPFPLTTVHLRWLHYLRPQISSTLINHQLQMVTLHMKDF